MKITQCNSCFSPSYFLFRRRWGLRAPVRRGRRRGAPENKQEEMQISASRLLTQLNTTRTTH